MVSKNFSYETLETDKCNLVESVSDYNVVHFGGDQVRINIREIDSDKNQKIIQFMAYLYKC